MSQSARPRWVAPVVVGFFAVCFLMFYVVAVMQRDINDARTGMSADWERLSRAQMQGQAGWADLQALMISNEPYVGSEAFGSLLQARDDAAYELAFERFPSVPRKTREEIRAYPQDDRAFGEAAKRVKGRDPKTMAGALLYLKVHPHRDANYDGTDATFKTLVSAIPDYEGDEADELAFTIGLFRPQSVTPLLEMLSHEKPRARQSAVEALGRIGRPTALPDVQKLLADPDPSVREAAKEAERRLSAAPP